MNTNENEQLNENEQESKKTTFRDLEEQVLKFEEKTGKKFSEYFAKYHPKLVYYVAKICNDGDVAQDLAIESFITGLEKIDKYDNTKAQYSTWLFTIARHSTLQWIKDNKKFVSIDMKVSDGNTSIKDFISDATDDDVKMAESNDITKRKAELVHSCILKLKQPYRKVIEMREIDKLSYKDIASKLGRDVFYDVDISECDKFPLPKEISHLHELVDSSTGNVVDGYKLIEGNSEKTPFYTHLRVSPGTYRLHAREPYNLSTLKSQIRNGRKLLDKMVKRDFKRIVDVYGDY